MIERLSAPARFIYPSVGSCPPFVAPTPFATTSLDFNGSSDGLSLGDQAALDSLTQVTFALWFRYDAGGWPTTARTLFSRNTLNNRAFRIEAQNRGGLGEIRVAFGNGTTLFSTYVPDNTCAHEWWHLLEISFDAGTVACFIDGRTITLQNSEAMPVALPNANSGFDIANAAGATRWNGMLANIAVWAGHASTLTQHRELWNNGEVFDWRTAALRPTPTFYIPGNTATATEVINGTTITGTHTTSTLLPVDRIYEDEMFERRFVLCEGNETWFAQSQGGAGFYTASPSVVRDSTGELLGTYSRGTGHSTSHVGFIFRSGDDGQTWPISDRDWPLDANNFIVSPFPHGNLSGAGSTKRSFTLSRIPEIGALGRMFVVINENLLVETPTLAVSGVTVTNNVAQGTVASTAGWSTGQWISTSGLSINVTEAALVQLTVVNATTVQWPLVGDNGLLVDSTGAINLEEGVRNVWVFYSDDDGATWSAAYEFVGAGVRWNSVGRARVVRRPNGDLLFGYYYTNPNEAGYSAAVAISTDDGLTWAHHVDIVSDGTAEYEEPYIGYRLDGTLMATVRVDTGSFTRRILRSISTDNGDTWPALQDITGGWSHPIWIQRPSDGLMVMINREDGGGVDDLAGGQIKVSRDNGATWSEGERVVMPTGLGRYMQGDLWITDDDKVGVIWAQDLNGFSSQRTRVEAGILRNCFLAQMS